MSIVTHLASNVVVREGAAGRPILLRFEGAGGPQILLQLAQLRLLGPQLLLLQIEVVRSPSIVLPHPAQSWYPALLVLGCQRMLCMLCTACTISIYGVSRVEDAGTTPRTFLTARNNYLAVPVWRCQVPVLRALCKDCPSKLYCMQTPVIQQYPGEAPGNDALIYSLAHQALQYARLPQAALTWNARQ